jgi:ribosome-binding protein aMBF1 (putative translation factor)
VKHTARLLLPEYIAMKNLRELRKTVDQHLAERNKELGKRLREARNNARLTQAKVGQLLGRDQTFVAKIELGTQRATFVEVERLARIYNTRLVEFWDEIPAVRRFTPARKL